MTPKKQQPEPVGMTPDDPRLPLKISRLKESRSTIASLSQRDPDLDDPEFDEWENKVEELLKEVFGAGGYLLRFRQLTIRPISYSMGGGRRWHADPLQAWKTGLPQAQRLLDEAIEEAELIAGSRAAGVTASATPRIHSNRVFLVHGHDDAAKEAVARFLEKLRVEAVILHEKPTEGRTVIEKLEHHSDVDFAVVLLTPDDVGSAKDAADELRPRARQNVVLELGYFVGLLGRKNVCALHKGALELPSDYVGVIYVPFDSAGGWRLHLAKELKSAGFSVDMNLAL
jgi:predicted nucleotide-binding protein